MHMHKDFCVNKNTDWAQQDSMIRKSTATQYLLIVTALHLQSEVPSEMYQEGCGG